ncbi:2-phospho-L-lactate guanylyltransferase [Pseudonocardia sp. RS11V-5]|uniref:2-phospho-L-lactate guanylyltransferase n=1 Tax=Pseudonocardia terrae TaxID=2905831 RepID=UPI001E477C58|nr:2-phospho-L-lactate guanylyltransferase [Pseudonocardia terrae]MCE3555752.1 2-phospho-L-lactate guanylyltransferase [Pseudonocardia terrae]
MSSREVGLVVPVKGLDAAKSRLRGAADGGVGDPARHAELALALALDTLDAVLGAERVAAVVVVTSDETVGRELAGTGVRIVRDEPAAGLNAALLHGAAALPRGLARGALQADLPALKPGELDEALEHAGTRAFCTDAQGDGTTLLLAPAGTPLDPHFGPGSAAAHKASGAAPLSGELPGLRRDVDTEADLREACAMGVGPRTAGLFVCR